GVLVYIALDDVIDKLLDDLPTEVISRLKGPPTSIPDDDAALVDLCFKLRELTNRAWQAECFAVLRQTPGGDPKPIDCLARRIEWSAGHNGKKCFIVPSRPDIPWDDDLWPDPYTTEEGYRRLCGFIENAVCGSSDVSCEIKVDQAVGKLLPSGVQTTSNVRA